MKHSDTCMKPPIPQRVRRRGLCKFLIAFIKPAGRKEQTPEELLHAFRAAAQRGWASKYTNMLPEDTTGEITKQPQKCINKLALELNKASLCSQKPRIVFLLQCKCRGDSEDIFSKKAASGLHGYNSVPEDSLAMAQRWHLHNTKWGRNQAPEKGCFLPSLFKG